MATVKLENGLLKFKVAPIQEGGKYGAIVECADLSSMTAETAEGKKVLPSYIEIYNRNCERKLEG